MAIGNGLMNIFEGETLENSVFSTEEVERLSGSTFRQLDYWVHQGYLPLNKPGRGSGSPRMWSADEATQAIAMGELVRAGIRPKTAFRVIKAGGSLRTGSVLIKVETVSLSTDKTERLAMSRRAFAWEREQILVGVFKEYHREFPNRYPNTAELFAVYEQAWEGIGFPVVGSKFRGWLYASPNCVRLGNRPLVWAHRAFSDVPPLRVSRPGAVGSVAS